MTWLYVQETPPTLRRLKLYLHKRSEEHAAAGRVNEQRKPVLSLRWASTENLNVREDSAFGRPYGAAMELLHAIQPYAAARSVAVALDTHEHCIVLERM